MDVGDARCRRRDCLVLAVAQAHALHQSLHMVVLSPWVVGGVFQFTVRQCNDSATTCSVAEFRVMPGVSWLTCSCYLLSAFQALWYPGEQERRARIMLCLFFVSYGATLLPYELAVVIAGQQQFVDVSWVLLQFNGLVNVLACSLNSYLARSTRSTVVPLGRHGASWSGRASATSVSYSTSGITNSSSCLKCSACPCGGVRRKSEAWKQRAERKTTLMREGPTCTSTSVINRDLSGSRKCELGVSAALGNDSMSMNIACLASKKGHPWRHKARLCPCVKLFPDVQRSTSLACLGPPWKRVLHSIRKNSQNVCRTHWFTFLWTEPL